MSTAIITYWVSGWISNCFPKLKKKILFSGPLIFLDDINFQSVLRCLSRSARTLYRNDSCVSPGGTRFPQDVGRCFGIITFSFICTLFCIRLSFVDFSDNLNTENGPEILRKLAQLTLNLFCYVLRTNKCFAGKYSFLFLFSYLN